MKQFLCPTCKDQVTRQSKYFPFCCARCQTIDLGRWADGSYSIAGDPVSEHESDEGHSIH